MNHYCTLFDSYYLIKGLTMYNSLAARETDFTLYILCFDEKTYTILHKLNLAHVILCKLEDFENDELLQVKKERTKGEYCWTCTPQVISFFMETYKLGHLTYLDADLYFYSDPAVLMDEFTHSGGSVLITEHRYTPAYKHLENTAGIYCVQFICFVNNKIGKKVLSWWKERCLEWCYARFEDGKFGDQKYLDNWPSMFEGIHVLEHLGGGAAPWNIQQYRMEALPSVNSVPVVFYHFHDFVIQTGWTFDYGDLPLSKHAKNYIYKPYIKALKKSLCMIQEIEPAFSAGIIRPDRGIRALKKSLKRLIKSQYYLVNIARKIGSLFRKKEQPAG